MATKVGQPSEVYEEIVCRSSYTLVPYVNLQADHSPGTGAKPLSTDFSGIDWMAQQNGGQFDPELFGDYRDPQDNILNGDFGGFFSDAFPIQDFNSPFNTGDIATPAPKRDLMQEVEDQKNGNDDEFLTQGPPQRLLSCVQLWYVLEMIRQAFLHWLTTSRFRDRVHTFEKDQGGANLDIDSLCSQLKAKARCHETGAGIDEKDVNEILGLAAKGAHA